MTISGMFWPDDTSHPFCGAWTAIYAPTWVYWWRLVAILLLIALVEALAVLAQAAG